jgi:uncharacterized protein YndB with AHSA1/START domain
MSARSCSRGFGAHGVTLTRRFPDDAATLFRAFTNAAALRQWWGPRDFVIDAITFPARVGEVYRVELTAPDGSRWSHEGRFLAVDPPHRLVYTWQWTAGPLSRAESLVELTFADDPAGTLVTISHSRFVSDVEANGHAAGWRDTVTRLTAWLHHRAA